MTVIGAVAGTVADHDTSDLAVATVGSYLPEYATPGSAGVDLRAASAVRLAPGERALVGTGLRVAIPAGFEGQIRPRSGLAVRSGITVLNSPGTVDSDYRGEVSVPLINLGSDDVVIEAGDRVAQMVIAPVVRATFHATTELDETARGSSGFGSTGTT